MVFDAICAKASFEKVDNATMLELTGLNLKQIVSKCEKPEACTAQFAQRGRNLWVRRHRREILRKLLLVLVINLDAARIRQHLHHSRTDIGERNVAAGHSQCGRIHDQVSEPEAHGPLVAKDPFKSWLHGLKIEKRFVDIKDDQRKSDHVTGLRFCGFCGRAVSYGW